MWDTGSAYELVTSAHVTSEIESSSSPPVKTLPTPVAKDDGKTPEAHRAMKARLKGGPRTAITSLAVLARADFEQPDEPLLPTPSAWLGRRPSHSEPNEERLENIRQGEQGSEKRSMELPDALALLPSPRASDGTRGPDYARGKRQEKSNRVGSEDLTTAATKFLPTPTGRDHKGRNQRDDASCLPGALDSLPMLPTPMANPENPGAGGELRAALTHGPSRRNTTGVDSWGRPNRGREKLLPTPTESDGDSAGSRNLEGSKAHAGVSLTDAVRQGDSTTPRLLPTPQAADGTGGRQEARAFTERAGKRPSGQKATLTLGTAIGLSGELTDRPFTDGNESSDAPPPGQLTIEDA